MRILHTSDWHLGVKRQQLDLREEHERFLAWLLDTMREHAVEVLVVAGDVFHHAQPSNAAQTMYYRFLAACTALERLRHVVIVAGNHDSATGIDAPREVLSALNVTVVGSLPRDPAQRPDRCLVPIPNADGTVPLVIAAVPYVQEAVLGVAIGDGGIEAMQRSYAAAFKALYKDLADAALAAYPDAALVTTGHMTVYGNNDSAKPGDYTTALHRTAPLSDRATPDVQDALRIGTLKALHPDVFDSRYQYVALGHIHRPMPVGGQRHIRYSGTPVATDRTEASPRRHVVLVDVAANQPTEVEVVEVPVWRDLISLTGSGDTILASLRTLQSDAELAPAIYIDVQLNEGDALGQNWTTVFDAVLDERTPRPLLMEVREIAAAAADEAAPAPMPAFDQLTDTDVFRAMYKRKFGGSEDGIEPLLIAFEELRQSLADQDGGDA